MINIRMYNVNPPDFKYIRKIRLEWRVIMDYVFPLNKKQGDLNDPDM
jgi:hypothetical protein